MLIGIVQGLLTQLLRLEVFVGLPMIGQNGGKGWVIGIEEVEIALLVLLGDWPVTFQDLLQRRAVVLR